MILQVCGGLYYLLSDSDANTAEWKTRLKENMAEVNKISVKCELHSVNNVHNPILLPNNQTIIIGRSCETKISDKRCSRNQANIDDLEVQVQQIGDNKAGINGKALEKNEMRILKHGDRLELLLGQHIYRVEFDPAPKNHENSECHSLKRPHSSTNSESKSAKEVLNGQAIKVSSQNTFLSGGCNNGTWETIGEGKLMVYTPHGLTGRNKIAAYDLDHTVITTKSGRVFPQDNDDWKIAFNEVPGKLKQLWKDGFKIVFFTNQAGIASGKFTPKDFKNKVHSVIYKLGVPVQTFVSTGSGVYRKPAPGMWDVLVENMNDDVPINIHDSFYCGDAAGRVVNWAPKKKKDFSSSDRLFALNVGLKFYTPEEFFLGQSTAKFILPEFNPASLSPEIPLCEPTSASLTLKEQEVVVLVGYPGSGKSFFTRTHMIPAGYCHINRDTLGSWQQCVAAMDSALRSGKSVIVDNTNPTRESRHKFVEAAKKLGIACRCFKLSTSKEHAIHNNKFREYINEEHEKVTDMIINMYRSKYEEPTVEEGFREIIKINFVPKFTNKDFEKLYKMYLG